MHAVGDAFGGLAGPHHAGDAVLARDDRRMREQATVVGNDPAQEREEDVEGLGCRFGDRTSPLAIRPNSEGPETRRAGPS